MPEAKMILSTVWLLTFALFFICLIKEIRWDWLFRIITKPNVFLVGVYLKWVNSKSVNSLRDSTNGRRACLSVALGENVYRRFGNVE